MYAKKLVTSIKEELINEGFIDLESPQQVINLLDKKEGTVLLVVNSVCGCAAGSARPGVKYAIHNASKQPDSLATVFAGVDNEATEKAREYFLPYPSSSPSIAFFKDGNLIQFIERHQIEESSGENIGNYLISIFQEHC